MTSHRTGTRRDRAAGGALVLGLGLASVALVLPGCSRAPQVAGSNRELIVSLGTAISARNADWLEANARKITQLKDEGQLSGPEYESFAAIVAQARSGDWAAAENALAALRDAQQPTAEDLKNIAERRLAPDHKALPPPDRGKRRAGSG